MFKSRFVECLGVAIAALIVVVGCGGGTNLPGETGTVHGQVVYGSGTIPQGSSIVMLHVETGIPAIGLTDASGKFAMEMRNEPKVLVGDYVVNIKPPGEIDDEVMKVTP
ncbi:MAG: hypothetical protein ACIALR_05915, partial [Blastopirellula sp. JB062]